MTTTPEPESLSVVAILTQQGVHMGDHAQDVTRAVIVDPGETVEHLVARTLASKHWSGERPPEPDKDRYLTLRLAVRDV